VEKPTGEFQRADHGSQANRTKGWTGKEIDSTLSAY